MNEKIERFLSTIGRSKNTVRTYRNALMRYTEIAGGNLDNESYEKFLSKIKDYSPSTKVVLRTAVQSLFDFYEVPGMEKRVSLNRHYRQIEPKRIIKIKEDLIVEVIKYCESLTHDIEELRDRAFVLFLADGGFRISELCSISRGDIDWKNQRVFVVGKGSKPAFIRLSVRAMRAMGEYLQERQKIDGGSGRSLNTLPVFVKHVANTDKLKRMTSDGMRKAIKQRMTEAGIDSKEVRIHDFRHYFVTAVYRSSGNIKTAQAFARHESIEITDRYTHLSDDELNEQYDRIFNK